MTKSEFESWKRETEKSRHHWQVDEVRRHNSGDLLFYKGGQSGQFIWIAAIGQASVGTYHGAIPHIGDAAFQILHTRRFSSQEEALKTVIEKAGLGFLMDFMRVGSI